MTSREYRERVKAEEAELLKKKPVWTKVFNILWSKMIKFKQR